MRIPAAAERCDPELSEGSARAQPAADLERGSLAAGPWGSAAHVSVVRETCPAAGGSAGDSTVGSGVWSAVGPAPRPGAAVRRLAGDHGTGSVVSSDAGYGAAVTRPAPSPSRVDSRSAGEGRSDESVRMWVLAPTAAPRRGNWARAPAGHGNRGRLWAEGDDVRGKLPSVASTG